MKAPASAIFWPNLNGQHMSSPVAYITATKFSVAEFPPNQKRVVLLILFSVVLVAPMLIFGVPANKDLANHFRFALPFYDSLSSGRVYPGWLAESNAGYGDASFRFYPPALYYFLGLTRTITRNWYSGTLAAIASLFMLGGLGIYFWAREYVSSQTAMWAAVLYGVAPYHLNQIYQAFLLAEFAGAAILPFVFAFAARVCARRRPQDIAGLAASYALLILTHLPLAVIGSLALGFYVLTNLQPKHRLETLKCVALSLALGLAASSCYWLTMVAELSWIRADNVGTDASVYYGNNFLLSTFSPDNLNVWWTNILLLSTVAMFWPGVGMCFRSAEKSSRKAKAAAILLLCTVFMTTPFSRPLWSLSHTLQATQFPWRWLTLTSIVGPLVFAMAIPFWTRRWKEGKRPIVLIAVGTIAISVAFSASHTIREAAYLDKSSFESTLHSIPGSKGVSQWWPVWVNEPIQPMDTPVYAENRMVSVKTWEPERRVFAVSAGQAPEARTRTFYYPHWVATGNGKLLATHPAEDGALMIAVPAEATTVELVFREPAKTRVSAIVSAIGWTFIGMILIFAWFKRTFDARKLNDPTGSHSPIC